MSFFKTYQTLIWTLSIPLLILLLIRTLGFDGLMGQDSYEYLRYTEQIKQFYLTGTHPGSFFWPKGYSLVAGLLALIMPSNIAIQLITALSFSGTLWFTHRLIKLVHSTNKNSTLFLVVALLFSPYFLRAGLNSMSDMLSIFCLTGSFYFGLSYFKNANFNTLLLCVVFGVYSIFTRYVAIIPISILFVSVLFFWFKNIKFSHLFTLIVPAIFMGIHVYFEANETSFLKHEFLMTWDILNAHKKSFIISDGALDYLFPNIIYALSPFFHPGFFFLGGVLGLFYLYKNRPPFSLNYSILIGVAIFSYALFLSGIPFQNNRFLTLTYPLAIVLLYAPFNYFLERFILFKKPIIGTFLLLQIVLSARALYPSYQLNRLEKKIATQLIPFQKQTLYSFDIDIALQGRGLNFDYKNLWIKEYSSFEPKALVLFNEEKLKKQWDGKNPMINWDTIKKNHQPKAITQFENGWKLYRIE